MPVPTFSHNLEDVVLQGVFAELADGFFIDVGAGTPIRDSNTYALYQKGWTGVAMEPLPMRELWRAFRPRDVFVNTAAGSDAGDLELHLYESLQLSSAAPATLAHWADNHRVPFKRISVPVMTLDQVCRQHRPFGEIHLLSVDVEGMEQQVLEGLDLAKYRPWVILLEATTPGTNVQSHQQWESDLVRRGYLMAFNDGINRYYLAQEHHGLLERFASPNSDPGFYTRTKEDAQALALEEKQLTVQISQVLLGTDAQNQSEDQSASELADVESVFRCTKCGEASAPVAVKDFLRCSRCGARLHLMGTRKKRLFSIGILVIGALVAWAIAR